MTIKSFKVEITVAGETYLADVWHHQLLSAAEKAQYQIREYSFLVHLFSLKGFVSFELFIDEDSMQWVTHPENILPAEVVERLGEKIDQRFGH